MDENQTRPTEPGEYQFTIHISNGVKVAAFVIVAGALLWYAMDFNDRADKVSADDAAGRQAAAVLREQQALQALKIEDIKAGKGAEAKPGDTLTVHYAGTLGDGTKFDSSYDRKEPLQFTLGSGQVIRGWDLGMLGVRAGGKRKLTIPPELAYGDRGVGPIPPNATLNFEVEVLNIKGPAPQ